MAKKRKKRSGIAPPRVPRPAGTPLRAHPNMRVVQSALRVDDTVRKLGEKGRILFRKRSR